MKPLMSDAEIRRRKKIQGVSSEVTGGLGLAALGGTLLATKRGSAGTKAAFGAVGRKRPGFLKPKKLKRAVAPLLATSAGIGGASSFNFAAYTKAESRKRGPNQQKKKKDPFAKSFSDQTITVEGIAKYDPEEKRAKRAKGYQGIATGAAYSAGAGAAYQGARAIPKTKVSVKRTKNTRSLNIKQTSTGSLKLTEHKPGRTVKVGDLQHAFKGGRKLTHTGKALGLGAAAAASAGAAKTIHHKRTVGSWT